MPSHIKTQLDAAAINIMRPKAKKKPKSAVARNQPKPPALELTCKFYLHAL